ncbi:alpha/beta fold hydrolase [Kribbella sp. NPDC051587]|uniref:alpha/beta fold hydrolase n=1 Tax=Kribbella sp. NPDC051587 TaxID=3364119 RepID=UPI0037AD4F8E
MPHKPNGRRTALGVLAVVTMLAGLSGCAETTPAPAAKPPSAPAAALRMTENKGRAVAFHVTPGRSRTIVLDSGGGEDSSYWNKLVPVLAAKTGATIVTYDRAGLGQSDELPGPWNVASAVSDLEAGLTQIGVTGPVLLVSHSQAGEVATYFAKDRPQQVAAAVLVDANVPNFFTDEEVARLDAAYRPVIAGLKNQPSTKKTRQLQATAANFGPAHRAYHRISWPHGIPVISIVSATTPFESPQDAQLWRNAQQTFVDAAPNRRLITAERSSHDVPKDRPDVVIAAIEQLLSAR